MIECQLCGTCNDVTACHCAAWDCGTALDTGPPGAGLQIAVPDWSPQLATGRPAAVGARLRNAGDRPQTVAVTVEGLPPGCATVRPSPLRLGPGERQTVRIMITLPPAPGPLPDGGWDCEVLATAEGAPGGGPGARARLRPRPPQVPPVPVPVPGPGPLRRRVRWRRRVVLPLELTGPTAPGSGSGSGSGSGERLVRFTAACGTPGVAVRVVPDPAVLRPGAATPVRVELRLPRRWCGPPEQIDCLVAGTAGEAGARVSITHRPVLPLPVLPLPVLRLLRPAVRRWYRQRDRARRRAPLVFPALPGRRLTPRRAPAAVRLPRPVATALGAMVVAGLAFGGLTLAAGSAVAPGRPAATVHGSGQAGGPGHPAAGAGAPTGGPAVPVPVAALPLAGAVTSTSRTLPATTGCTGAAAVPDVSRESYPQSSRTLLAAGFPGLDIAGHSAGVPLGGTVSQSPAPGSVQPCGTGITLVYSSGPAPAPGSGLRALSPPLCTLPPADGPASALLDQLRTLLADDRSSACRLLVTSTGGYSATVPAGGVISEDPMPGARVGLGSAVLLTVSLGAPTCLLPPVTGDPAAVAMAALDLLRAVDDSPCDLVLVSATAPSATVAPGSVLAQSPSAGTAVAPGAVVTLTLSSGPAPTPTPSPSPSLTPPLTPPPTDIPSASPTDTAGDTQGSGTVSGSPLPSPPTAVPGAAPDSDLPSG